MIPEWCKRAEQETHKAVRTYLDEVLDFHPLQSVLDECIPVSAIIAKHAPDYGNFPERNEPTYKEAIAKCNPLAVRAAEALEKHFGINGIYRPEMAEIIEREYGKEQVRELVEAARAFVPTVTVNDDNEERRLRRALEPFKEVS